MELMEALRTRRSVRKYSSAPVERATIDRLLEVATWAPSASNTQPWAFGTIEGVELLRAYSDRTRQACLSLMDRNPSMERYRTMLSNPDFNVFYDAPVALCIYAKSAAGLFAMNDCALATYGVMLAAHDMGLATCWIGFAQRLFDQPEMNAELGIPAEYRAVCQLALGYPKGDLPSPTSRNTPEVLFRI